MDDRLGAHDAAAELWRHLDGDAALLDDLSVTGSEPVLPSVFPVATAAAAAIGATGLAAAALWQRRGGTRQAVGVDLRHAAVAFRSERHLRVGDAPPFDPWHPVSGFYPAAAGRWVQLHTNFPHHLDAVTSVLGVAPEREAVAAAIGGWDAVALEDAVAAAGGCATTYRTTEEWRSHPQGAAVARLPVIAIERRDDAEPVALPAAGDRPLSGVRVLDLTRVIAGPVCGRTLAALGADVLRVGAAHLPTIPTLVVDTGFGKRFCHLDLRDRGDAATFTSLVHDADIVLEGYRPGALDGLGFGPDGILDRNPSAVVVSLCAYGQAGPWAARRGFDSLVQTASGIAHAEASARGSDQPVHLPAQALDHGTAWLAALGAMVALDRRATQGGGHIVRVSLARTGRWLEDLGRLDPDALTLPQPGNDDVADLLDVMPSGRGDLVHVRFPLALATSPPRWDRPPPVEGADPPAF